MMRDTSVGHLSHVGDSVLTEDVNFAAGTVVANLRHGDSTVRATIKGERTNTSRRKFGVVCWPETKTGINTSPRIGKIS